MMTRLPARHRAFTIVEVLVVIGVLAVLIAILLPAMRSARVASMQAASGSNLRQLGTATLAYLSAWHNHLPQKAIDVGGGTEVIIGSLFGGKRGQLPQFGINTTGADARPLNRYLTQDRPDPDEDMPMFESPLDIGMSNPAYGSPSSMYEFLGSSYTLNDHSLEGDEYATLVPSQSPSGRPGGRMPVVTDTSKTWMLAEHPIYNFQANDDRGMRWVGTDVRASMCFVDGSVQVGVIVPPGVVNTTEDYTFLPRPDWPD